MAISHNPLAGHIFPPILSGTSGKNGKLSMQNKDLALALSHSTDRNSLD
jgi:hypothetical protein